MTSPTPVDSQAAAQECATRWLGHWGFADVVASRTAPGQLVSRAARALVAHDRPVEEADVRSLAFQESQARTLVVFSTVGFDDATRAAAGECGVALVEMDRNGRLEPRSRAGSQVMSRAVDDPDLRSEARPSSEGPQPRGSVTITSLPPTTQRFSSGWTALAVARLVLATLAVLAVLSGVVLKNPMWWVAAAVLATIALVIGRRSRTGPM